MHNDKSFAQAYVIARRYILIQAVCCNAIYKLIKNTMILLMNHRVLGQNNAKLNFSLHAEIGFFHHWIFTEPLDCIT